MSDVPPLGVRFPQLDGVYHLVFYRKNGDHIVLSRSLHSLCSTWKVIKQTGYFAEVRHYYTVRIVSPGIEIRKAAAAYYERQLLERFADYVAEQAERLKREKIPLPPTVQICTTWEPSDEDGPEEVDEDPGHDFCKNCCYGFQISNLDELFVKERVAFTAKFPDPERAETESRAAPADPNQPLFAVTFDGHDLFAVTRPAGAIDFTTHDILFFCQIVKGEFTFGGPTRANGQPIPDELLAVEEEIRKDVARSDAARKKITAKAQRLREERALIEACRLFGIDPPQRRS